MSPSKADFDIYYDDEVPAFRHIYRRETFWDRLSQPTAVLSILILVFTVVYHSYAAPATLSDAVSLIGTCLWDLLVFIVPERLLNTLDDWVNPTLVPRPMSQTLTSHEIKSATMRRVLKLGRSGGVMASVFEVRKRTLSMTGSVLGLKLDSDKPAGLGNRDNSCYQNSILQGLASLEPLPEYLSAYLQSSDIEDDGRDVAQTLRTLIADLNDASNNGRTIWTPKVLKNMSTWTQQDAQEYYSKILDDIDKSVAKASKSLQRHPGLEANLGKDDTIASQYSDDSGYQSVTGSSTPSAKLSRNPLEGLLAQRVACVDCGYSEGLSMIPFTCLTLSLGLDKSEHDLYERLDAYSKVEMIENVECGKCTLLKFERLLKKLVDNMRAGQATEEQLEKPIQRLEAVQLALEDDDFDEKTLKDKCNITPKGKVNSTKTKQMVIARPPESLAIHVNRSVFDPSTFNMMKNSAPVNFPKTLDLGPWCLGSSGEVIDNFRRPAPSKPTSEDEEHWISHPRASMVAGDLRPSMISGPIYELRAVVTHYGRHENGHYICYRKHPRHLPNPPKLAVEKEDTEPGEPETPTMAAETADNEGEADDSSSDSSCGDTEMDWWRLSDHNVSMVDEETVLRLSPGVFMLFYDCVDPMTIQATEQETIHDAEEFIEGTKDIPPEPTSQKDGFQTQPEGEAEKKPLPAGVEVDDRVLEASSLISTPDAGVDQGQTETTTEAPVGEEPTVLEATSQEELLTQPRLEETVDEPQSSGQALDGELEKEKR